MAEPKLDPTYLAILEAINANRVSVEQWQRGHSERMGLLERDLRDTTTQLHDHMTHEETELKSIGDLLRQHITDSAAWRQKNDAEMAENTTITREIKNVRTFGRVGISLVKWAGAVVLALGSIWWGIKEMFGHSNITPGP